MILLAAGFGSRFGSNKLLYEMGGKPMYRHTLDVMLSLARELKGADVTVVTRYEEIYRDAKETGALCLMNRHSDPGDIILRFRSGWKLIFTPERMHTIFSLRPISRN